MERSGHRLKTKHALAIGCTGMLLDAAAHLGSQCDVLTALGRNERRLETLKQQIRPSGAVLNAIVLDYTNTDGLISELKTAMAQHGPITQALLWIHSTAPYAPTAITQLLSRESSVIEIFHVLGSSAADPSRSEASLRSEIEALGSIVYYEVILGYMIENSRSRWLSDSEISQGVIGAMEQKDSRSVIGVVEPWELRP